MSRKSTKPYHTERKLFYASLSLVLVLFCAYVSFVSASVAHVVVRKEINQEITETQTKVSELESAFIIAKYEVLEEEATKRGFHKNEDKIFIEKKSTGLVLTRNDES